MAATANPPLPPDLTAPPWRVTGPFARTDGVLVFRIVAGDPRDPYVIADLRVADPRDLRTQAANAAMLARAPELYLALERRFAEASDDAACDALDAAEGVR